MRSTQTLLPGRTLFRTDQGAAIDAIARFVDGPEGLVELRRRVGLALERDESALEVVEEWCLASPVHLVDNGLLYSAAVAAAKAGYDHRRLLTRNHQIKLELWRSGGLVDRVRVASAGGCAACAMDDGREYSLVEALEKAPIPHPGCTYDAFSNRGFCRCTYIAVF